MFPSLDQLSHATIITGNREENLVAFQDFLVQQGFAITANPDFYLFNDEQLLMDDATTITRMLTAQKLGSHRVYIIACDRISHEVQNTLLKTIEDIYPGTYILLLVPNTDMLLPTIISRSQIIKGKVGAPSSQLREQVTLFLASSPTERFSLIESWVKNKKEEDNLTKADITVFITELEQVVWKSGNRDRQLFIDIERMRDYVQIRGASHRVILDFLAMISPKLDK